MGMLQQVQQPRPSNAKEVDLHYCQQVCCPLLFAAVSPAAQLEHMDMSPSTSKGELAASCALLMGSKMLDGHALWWSLLVKRLPSNFGLRWEECTRAHCSFIGVELLEC